MTVKVTWQVPEPPPLQGQLPWRCHRQWGPWGAAGKTGLSTVGAGRDAGKSPVCQPHQGHRETGYRTIFNLKKQITFKDWDNYTLVHSEILHMMFPLMTAAAWAFRGVLLGSTRTTRGPKPEEGSWCQLWAHLSWDPPQASEQKPRLRAAYACHLPAFHTWGLKGWERVYVKAYENHKAWHSVLNHLLLISQDLYINQF